MCKLIGQIQSLGLAWGLVYRLQSRYLNLSVLAAAQGRDYSRFTNLHGRAVDEVRLRMDGPNSPRPRAMLACLRRPDVVLESDANDTAIGGIVTKCFDEKYLGEHIYRVLIDRERLYGSAFRELISFSTPSPRSRGGYRFEVGSLRSSATHS